LPPVSDYFNNNFKQLWVFVQALSTRIDHDTKVAFTYICDEVGLSPSQAIQIFAKADRNAQKNTANFTTFIGKLTYNNDITLFFWGNYANYFNVLRHHNSYVLF